MRRISVMPWDYPAGASMSLYAQYIKELRGDQIVEDDKGFATFRYLDNGQCYLIDIFVLPEFRHTKHASSLADKVCALARNHGCRALIGTVCPTYSGSTDSLKVLLGYGMKLTHIDGSLIVFRKEI